MDLWQFFRRLWLTAADQAETGAGRDDPAAAVGRFHVLVTAFPGDTDGAHEAVAAALEGIGALSVQRVAMVPEAIGDDGGTPVTLARVTARMRSLAQAGGALVTVTGRVADGRLRLHFIPTEVDDDPASGTMFPGDHVDLPLPQGGSLGELGALAAACTLAALPLTTDAARRQRLDALRDSMTAVDGLLRAPASPLAEAARPAAALCYAAMVAEAGFRTAQQSLLDRARDVTRRALAEGRETDSLTPAQVAAARGRLGDLLSEAGGRARDAAVLDEAATHLRAAGKLYSLELFPPEHAHLMAQLGRTLHRLSALSNKSAHMREAVQAYHLACQVWTKAAAPQRWAEMQNAMGALLGQIGEFTGKADVLERACRILNGAAEVWTRKEAPRRWAGLQNNIGACRFAQGKRTGDLPPLREAAECFSFALEVYLAENMTRNIHVTQKNLARVERLIAVQEGRG